MSELKAIVEGLEEYVQILSGDALIEGINDPYILRPCSQRGDQGPGNRSS